MTRILALAALVSWAVCGCKTGSTPDGGTPTPPLTTVLVDCATIVGGPVVGVEVPKVSTCLTGNQVGPCLDGVVSEITAKGFAATEALAYVACVVKNELGLSRRDAAFGSAPAALRVAHGCSWIAARGVTYADGPPPACAEGAQ